jgi:hypothetical protein
LFITTLLMARLATTVREVAGPHRSLLAQSESLEHTTCEVLHIRIGPGVPCVLGTQVSVELTGNWQLFAGGRLQILVGMLQVLLVAVHLLSVCMLQTPGGRLHTLGVPTHWLSGGDTQ